MDSKVIHQHCDGITKQSNGIFSNALNVKTHNTVSRYVEDTRVSNRTKPTYIPECIIHNTQ